MSEATAAITLTGLEVYGYHGVFPEEKSQGQIFRIDARCYIAKKDFLHAAQYHQLQSTLHYGELAETIAHIVAGPSYDLIESLALHIADTALDEYPILQSIEITVHKPHAPIQRPFQDVSVTITRSRQEQEKTKGNK